MIQLEEIFGRYVQVIKIFGLRVFRRLRVGTLEGIHSRES